jgi:hypothetical protein
MRSHLATLFVAALVFFASAPLYGQSYADYASGSTNLRSTFNPVTQSVPTRIPGGSSGQVGIPHPPVIPPDQYQKTKSVPPRIPTGAPSSTWFSPSGSPVNVPARLPLTLSPTIGFQGIQQTIYHPPSSNIAVGPQDVIQIVNSTVARYDRTGTLTNQTDLTQWFPGLYPFTICNSLNVPIACIFGDVNINYDQMHGRFIMTLQVLDQTSRTSYLMISVSPGATYAGTWTSWALSLRNDGQTTTNFWGDFPQVGIDNTALYVTTNQFTFAPFTFQYAKLRIIKKSDLYSANPTSTLPYQDIFNLKNADNTVASTLQVPHLRGRTQIATSNGFYMINASDTPNATYLTLWQINNPTSSTPTVTRITLNNVWAYSYPTSAPQAGSTIPLDTGPSSFNRVILREGLMYTSQNTGYADEPDTVTYDLIDVINNRVTLQQRWVNGNFFYPAFDVPASIGPGNTLPNNLIVGTTTSPTGTLTFGGITNVKAGEDFYDLVAPGATAARWGDYFGGAVDPIQGGLWVSGEYAKPHVNNLATWGTWNAYFPWATSQGFTDVDLSSPDFNYINVLKLWGITKGYGSSSVYAPNQQVTRESLAAFVIRSLYGDTFPYPTTPYFTDVPITDPNFPYVQKLKEQGITLGCAATLFCPNDIATRETAAVFIIRGKMKGLFGDNFPFPATQIFNDVPSTDPNFSFVQKFSEMGLTNGCSATPALFCPNAPLTRDMTAVFLVRAFFN